MKVSTTQIFERSIEQMSNQRTKVAEMQAKLASGKQIVQPSDDAEKAGLIQRLDSAYKRQEVYESTLDSVMTRLEVEESAVTSAEAIMQRARELAVQAGNGTLTDGDRKILAQEVSSLRDELLALANSQDATGNYVFSGSMAQTPAFVESADGTVNYRGDDNRVQVAISEQRSMFMNRPGDEIFTSIVRSNPGQGSERVSFFNVMDDFANALSSNSEEGVQRGLTEISGLTEGMATAIADVGTRMNTVQNQQDILGDNKLRYQALLSNAEDLDYAKAVTELSAEMLSMEAAQASFAKISQLSLFDYLR
ncbi:MAG: flagellar hook-associated protein FlgL [Porticoccaceae bacterium]|nr:flagellar hook-associated protein FlgL [Porticoccaceae bacterium]